MWIIHSFGNALICANVNSIVLTVLLQLFLCGPSLMFYLPTFSYPVLVSAVDPFASHFLIPNVTFLWSLPSQILPFCFR
jgi:hypothetical protein